MGPEPESECARMKVRMFLILYLAGLTVFVQSVRADAEQEIDCTSTAGPPAVGSETTPGSQKDHFERSLTEAECFRKAAATAGAEWLKTEDLLSRATAEAENGHWDIAVQLVEKARFQAETALSQAEYEALAWKRRVIRKQETE
jgi:hypothetical protein